MMEDFYQNPTENPLDTPSGKIEIFSNTIAGFNYADCPGHPTWFEPLEWLGNATPAAPLHMISNQPKDKLHSQFAHGAVSRAGRLNGLEPVLMHPKDAATRELTDGQTLRIHNTRGACFGALRISDEIRENVIQMSTGAWFDPDSTTCREGNPNVLTPDKGTSSLAQGPIAHSCLVQVEAYTGPLPKSQAHQPPEILKQP